MSVAECLEGAGTRWQSPQFSDGRGWLSPKRDAGLRWTAGALRPPGLEPRPPPTHQHGAVRAAIIRSLRILDKLQYDGGKARGPQRAFALCLFANWVLRTSKLLHSGCRCTCNPVHWRVFLANWLTYGAISFAAMSLSLQMPPRACSFQTFCDTQGGGEPRPKRKRQSTYVSSILNSRWEQW